MRPDEKFLKYGPGALSDAELLAVIIRTGNAKEHSVDLAGRILSSKNDDSADISSIFDFTVEELMQIQGVGKVKALQIKAVCELSTRIAAARARRNLVFNNPAAVSDFFMEQLRHLKREVVILLMLSASCELIKQERLFEGTATAALFSPREIYLEALRYGAVSIILIHNHPSGNPAPSEADIAATKRIYTAGQYIGIGLMDHIIIGDNCYTSLKEEGYIKDEC